MISSSFFFHKKQVKLHMKFKNRISATTKNAPQILEYFQFLFWILKFQSEPENTLHFAKKKGYIGLMVIKMILRTTSLCLLANLLK